MQRLAAGVPPRALETCRQVMNAEELNGGYVLTCSVTKRFECSAIPLRSVT